MGQFSKVEIEGRLMIATINRPEVLKACHPCHRAIEARDFVFTRYAR